MRVLLIDDHALVRKGLEALLQSRNIEVAASVGSGQEGVDQATKEEPDVILLDINMPGMNGLDTLKALRQNKVAAPVLMLTMSREEADLRAALQNGAQGYLLKDMEPDELIPALEAVAGGDNVVAKEMVGSLTRIVQSKNSGEPDAVEESPFSGLTPRELEILGHIAEGQSNKAIARDLDISDGTVKLHVKSILRKLGMHSRVEAAVKAVEHGLGGKLKQ